jgi:hypothetical protein
VGFDHQLYRSAEQIGNELRQGPVDAEVAGQ